MSEKVHFSIHRENGRKSTEKILCLGVDNWIYSVYIKGTKEIQCFVPWKLNPRTFPRKAGEIRISAYQGHAGKMERNI
jgi:hypothetical protein